MKPTLIFVYNANSGMLNGMWHSAHKLLSPSTYECSLCAITHGNFGPHKAWSEFLEQLDYPMEFLHKDELKEQYNYEVALPAILQSNNQQLTPFITAETLNAVKTLEELQALLTEKLDEQ